MDANEFQRLTAAFGLPPTPDSRYKATRVIEMFEDAGRPGHSSELDSLLSIRSRSEKQIGWSHVIELLQVPERRLRRQLAQQVVRDGLRADALRQLIRQHQDQRGSRRPRSGRPRRPPLNAWHAITRAQGELAALKSTLNWMAEAPEWPRTGQRRRLLNEAKSRLDDLEETLQAIS